MNSRDTEDLIKRILIRCVVQEFQKQSNIESVAQKAIEMLNNKDKIEDTPIETGWINRFIDSVQYIDDESLQDLWAKILAGEIVKPNSYSLRTLELLKNMTPKEAKLFEELTKYTVKSKTKTYLIRESYLLAGLPDYNYNHIQLLQECGLIMNAIEDYVFFSDNILTLFTDSFVIDVKKKNNIKTRLNVFNLTQSGMELCSIINPKSEINDMIKIWDSVAKNRDDLSISIYEIVAISNDNIHLGNLVWSSRY